MALRTGHGNGAGMPRVEVLPVDELPQCVQGEPLADHTHERDAKLGLLVDQEWTSRENRRVSRRVQEAILGTGFPFDELPAFR